MSNVGVDYGVINYLVFKCKFIVYYDIISFFNKIVVVGVVVLILFDM